MGAKPSDEPYSEKETIQRREAALKRMLSTPHKPHSESKLGKKSKAKSRKKKAKPGR
jgi:hypothetical protein